MFIGGVSLTPSPERLEQEPVSGMLPWRVGVANAFGGDIGVLGLTKLQQAIANGPDEKLNAEQAALLAKQYPGTAAVEAGTMTEPAARIYHERQQHEKDAANMYASTPWPWEAGGSYLGTIGRGVSQMAAQPTNLAAFALTKIPGGLATTLAARTEAATNMASRAGWRAITGGTQGLMAGTLLEGASAPLRASLGDEVIPAESALNIGLMGALGAALHAGAGAFGDVFTRRPGAVPPEARPVVPAEVAAAAPETNIAAAQVAQEQALRGQVVNVDPVYDAAGATPTDAQRVAARAGPLIEPWQMTSEEWRQVQAKPGLILPKDETPPNVDHATAVAQAVADGKPAPTDVLAEYPDLQQAISERQTRAAGEAQATLQANAENPVTGRSDTVLRTEPETTPEQRLEQARSGAALEEQRLRATEEQLRAAGYDVRTDPALAAADQEIERASLLERGYKAVATCLGRQ